MVDLPTQKVCKINVKKWRFCEWAISYVWLLYWKCVLALLIICFELFLWVDLEMTQDCLNVCILTKVLVTFCIYFITSSIYINLLFKRKPSVTCQGLNIVLKSVLMGCWNKTNLIYFEYVIIHKISNHLDAFLLIRSRVSESA